MRHGRRRPYTDRGIRRLPCCVAGCTNRASASWQVCADGGLHRPICSEHDRAMNRLALLLVGDPDVEAKMARYAGAGA